MCLGATKLDNVETFSKSDPFVRVSKMRESGTWIPVLKTEVGGLAGSQAVLSRAGRRG